MKRLLLVTILFLLIGYAQADLSFYTNRANWETALGEATTNENFDAVSPHLLSAGTNSAGLVSIELIGLAGQSIWNAIDDGSGAQSVNGSRFFQGGSNSNNTAGTLSGADFIDLHLPYAVTAFGGDFYSTHSGAGLTLSINGQTYEFTDLLPDGIGSGFLGFISTDAFSIVRLFDAEKRETFGLDNLSFAAPEPTTLVLLAVGGLAILRRKRKK